MDTVCLVLYTALNNIHFFYTKGYLTIHYFYQKFFVQNLFISRNTFSTGQKLLPDGQAY